MESHTDNDLIAHREMMFNLFVANGPENEKTESYLNKGLELLRSGKVDPCAEDNQLFRELKCHRWIPEYQDRIYQALTKVFIDRLNAKNEAIVKDGGY